MSRSVSLPTRRGTAVALLSVAGLAETALAHGGEESSSTGLLHSRTVAAALFLVGVVVLAVSIYLDYEGRASRRRTDAGVAVGVFCVLGSMLALWL